VEVSPGLGFFNGAAYDRWSYTVRTPCSPEAPCPAPDGPTPSITGPPDAGVDAGVELEMDMGADATPAPNQRVAEDTGCDLTAHHESTGGWWLLLLSAALCVRPRRCLSVRRNEASP